MNLMRTPKSVEIGITNKCNLRCLYCSYFTSAGEVPSDLPQEEWFRFFEELNRCAVLSVTLSGGEPFFRSDIKDIINGIVGNRMRFTILSNGTLITDNTAAFIKASGRCDTVQVSLDGSTPDTHDVCRGEGNFEKALRGLKVLLGHKLPVSVRMTINKHNVRDLDAISRLLLDEIGLPGFSTNAASHMGVCRHNADDIQLNAEERSLAMETLLRLVQKYPGRISAQAGPLAEARMWMEMEKAREQGLPSLPGKGCLTGCGGMYTKISVRADGIMTPCVQMGHIELGRINKDSLIDVWHNHAELMRLRRRGTIPLTEFEFCKGCEYIPYCGGNCPALSYTLVGQEDHPSPDACLRKFLSEGGRLPDETLYETLKGGACACG